MSPGRKDSHDRISSSRHHPIWLISFGAKSLARASGAAFSTPSSSVHSSAYPVWPSAPSLLRMLWSSPQCKCCGLWLFGLCVLQGSAAAMSLPATPVETSVPAVPPTQNTLVLDFYVMQSLTSSRFLLQCCFPDHLVEKSVPRPLCVRFPALFSTQFSSSLDLLRIY